MLKIHFLLKNIKKTTKLKRDIPYFSTECKIARKEYYVAKNKYQRNKCELYHVELVKKSKAYLKQRLMGLEN